MSRFSNLPQARDGLPQYFRAAYEACRLEQLALRNLELESQSYELELSKLIDEAFSGLFSFGLVYAQKDEFSGSAPNLRAVHKFLSDLFQPGGPFHKGQPSAVFYKPNPILWAPLANLIVSDPEEFDQLNKVIAWHIISSYLNCTEHFGTEAQKRFESDYLLLRNKIGGAEYEHWVRHLMKSMPDYLGDHEVVSGLLNRGHGLDALHRWKVDLYDLMVSGTQDMARCRLDGQGFLKLVDGYQATISQLSSQGSLDTDGALKLHGSLLQAGLVAWKRADLSANGAHAWPAALIKVYDGVNENLSPGEWLTYLSISALKDHHQRATDELKKLPSSEVFEAIKAEWPKPEDASQRLALVMALDLRSIVPEVEWLALTSASFCIDLGL